MSTIDPSLLNSIFKVVYSYGPDPGDTVSYTRARINISNVHTLNVDTLAYSSIQFGDASGNMFVGDGAGCNVTLASNCTGLGEQSMETITQGSNVTGVGFSSLRDTTSLTRVIAIGTYAGDSNSNVADTVIVGDSAARNLSGATSNVIIGSGAGASLSGGNNNILIGAGVNPVSGSNNNIFNLGNTLSGTVGGPISTVSNFTVNGALLASSLSVGGTISALTILGNNLSIAGTISGVQGYYTGNVSAGSFNVQTFTASMATIGWNTLGGQGSGTGQSYQMFLVDTDVGTLGAGTSNQLLAYAYPATTKPSVRGTSVKSWSVLLSDQAIFGLSTGDVYIENTLAVTTGIVTNLSVSSNLSVNQNVSVGGIVYATTVSAINLYGNLILGVQTV